MEYDGVGKIYRRDFPWARLPLGMYVTLLSPLTGDQLRKSLKRVWSGCAIHAEQAVRYVGCWIPGTVVVLTLNGTKHPRPKRCCFEGFRPCPKSRSRRRVWTFFVGATVMVVNIRTVLLLKLMINGFLNFGQEQISDSEIY